MFDWAGLGIYFGGGSFGQKKVLCPQCSRHRRHSRDKCLSINLENGTYNCHHCGWSGKAESMYADSNGWKRIEPRVYRKPDYKPVDNPDARMLKYFSTRGISERTVRKLKVETRMHHMGNGHEERVLAFPFFRSGEVINVQYRSADKDFRLESEAELILYNEDAITEGEDLIVCEGQIDVMSIIEAGFDQVVSVPAGAQIRNAAWLTLPKLEKVKRILLAGDNDQPGRECMAEIARRLGAERCFQVEWPDGCKDANDTLVKIGIDSVAQALTDAQPLPVAGLIQAGSALERLKLIYRQGLDMGVELEWDNVTKIYRPRLGELTIVTGIPNMGKSSVMNAIAVDFAKKNLPVAFYSPEQAPVEIHVATLAEIWAGVGFFHGERSDMDWQRIENAIAEFDDMFAFFEPETPSLEGILELARVAVTRIGIRGLVIDPWNEIEHARPSTMTETEYVAQSLSKIKAFARQYQVHVWLIAHPRKLDRDASGNYPVPSVYDISSSAHFANKADVILSVHRDRSKPGAHVDIHVQKIRFRETGQLGTARLWYNQSTGELSEVETVVVGE